MNKEIMLNRLVENAFDFLSKSVDELTTYPKFSVINFHAAVELFLKARLMEEHWTLVISQRQQPDWDKFISGDFQSVSLDGAAEHLEKVVRSGLNKKELTVFREVTKHRNKVVHFFHEVHSEEKNNEKLIEIVKEQLTAWYFLHNLISKRWISTFEKWSPDLIRIDSKLKSLHTFLHIVYEQIKPEIEKKKKEGTIFDICPSCKLEALESTNERKAIFDSNCHVCGLSEKIIKVECPDCDSEVTFVSEGHSRCDECGKIFEPEDLASELIDSGAAHMAAMDGDDSMDAGNCSDCDGYHTVVTTESEEIICTSCFSSFEYLQRCGWCNEPNTGDMEHSNWSGCNHCDGQAGWVKDD